MHSAYWVFAMGIAWCAVGRMASAQLLGIAVDPHVVVLTERHPTGKVIVFNPKATAAEYSIRLRYGWILTDSAGIPHVHVEDVPLDTTRIAQNDTSADGSSNTPANMAPTNTVSPHRVSAASWITPYPRTFILNPGASQTVRLLATPPRKLPDGEYWARLIIQSRELVAPLARHASQDSSVHVGLSIETSTLLPIFYRTGTITTGIAIDTLSAHRIGDSLVISASLRRLGNAAYVGAAQLSLTSDTSTLPITARTRISAYQTLTPRWTLPLPRDTLPRPYHLTLRLSTERPDVPIGTVIRAPTVVQTLEVPP